MATHPRLVNKQFNSPIGLYSAQNVQEILEKNTQILANGAVGVDFHNPNVGKPANLQNSAVLRMLEEEENRRRNGYAPGSGVAPKRVAWPPPNESGPDSPYIEQNAVTQQSPQVQTARPFEPPPSTITLRPQAPVSQAPPPVYASQPATATIKVTVSPQNLRGDQKWPPEGVKQSMLREAENLNTSNSFLSLQGGKHLRGDLKWPPENVKMQAEEENRLRIELAKGPVCRPRRPNKDYTAFFAQNALNSTYPGYKIPPGTQFFRQF